MIDAHCHLNVTYTKNTLPGIIERFATRGGKHIIDVTTSYDEIALSQVFIEIFPNIIYATIGIHPEKSTGDESKHRQLLNDLTRIDLEIPQLKNIVGIGETGIDYSHEAEFPNNYSPVIEQQRELFVAHIIIAKKHNLPLTIHARGKDISDYQAYEDILAILKQEHFSLPVYFHSFGGNYELAKRIIDNGNYLGVNGIVTYSNAKALTETITKIPLEHILLETDAPFLIPSNLERKELASPKTNEPFAIYYTAKRIATLRNMSVEDILVTATSATKKIFVNIL
ncbi:TatD family hydrolase [bacterium]|nr:TatD family hydrolase [bacterium]